MPTILIVDDSPTIRRMVRASLAGLSADFVEASSGLEAIEALAVHTVSAMTLDLNMPDMHGLDVLRFVRTNSQYAHIPILVLTTRGDAASQEGARQNGATAYMTKPFAPPAVAAALKDLLSHHVDA